MFSLFHVAPGPHTSKDRLVADTITGTEYAFHTPASLAAGRHALAFVNAGTQTHEFKLFVLAEGRTLSDFMAEHSAWRRNRARVGVAATPAAAVLASNGGANPGGVLEVDMQPGRVYAIVCDFSETRDGPSHASLGMFGGITVTPRPRR